MRMDPSERPVTDGVTSRAVSILLALALLTPFAAVAQDDAPTRWTFDVGAGARVFQTEAMDDVYGTGLIVLAGVSYDLEPDWSAFRVDLTYTRDEGEELSLDDTFVIDPSRNDAVGLSLGLRFGPQARRDRPVAFRAGFGGHVLRSSWRPPIGDRVADWIPGVWADISPRIYVARGLEAWAMFRVRFSPEQELEEGFEPFDHDDFDFLVGVSRVSN